MSPSMPLQPEQISLIVTTYNRPDALDLVLESLSRQTVLPGELIVADDGSTKATADVVSSWAARLKMPVRHLWQEDLGFRLNRSRNRAIAAARGEYLVMVDGDMVLDKNFIADHAQAAEQLCFVQGIRIKTDLKCTEKMLRHELIQPYFFTRGLQRRQHTLRIPWLSRHLSSKAMTLDRIKGCNQGFWKKDLLAVNGFNEAMTGWGPDDKECAIRLFNIGIQRKHLPFAALAVHLYHPISHASDTNPNQAIFQETLAQQFTRCTLGLDLHLQEFAAGIPASARPPY